MKLIIFFLLLSFGANAQPYIDANDVRRIRYDSAIVIQLPAKNGIERQAKFVGFNFNLESQQLHIIWRVTYGSGLEFYGKDSELKYQVADVSTFVDMEGNIIDTTGRQLPYMSEIDFYKMIAQRGTGANNATINQLITMAGLRPGKWKE